MDDIDMLSRRVPCLCKVAPNTQKYHIQDVNRAGGILNILGELAKGGLLKTDVNRVDGMTLADAIRKYSVTVDEPDAELNVFTLVRRVISSILLWALRMLLTKNSTPIVPMVVSVICNMLIVRTEVWPF